MTRWGTKANLVPGSCLKDERGLELTLPTAHGEGVDMSDMDAPRRAQAARSVRPVQVLGHDQPPCELAGGGARGATDLLDAEPSRQRRWTGRQVLGVDCFGRPAQDVGSKGIGVVGTGRAPRGNAPLSAAGR